MNNTPWTADELAALTTREWEAFHAGYPERSYEAYRQKRGALRKGRTPTEKTAPVLGDPLAEKLDLDDDAFLDEMVRWQGVLNRVQEMPLEFRLTLPVSEPIVIAFMSDWHIGSKGCDTQKLRADIDLIASHPRVYAAVGGDPIDNFIFDKMASAARSSFIDIQLQWKTFAILVKKLLDSKSLLWVSSGNHDAWTQKAAGIDGVLSSLAGVPCIYTGEGGWVHLTIGTVTYTIYRKHRPDGFNSRLNLTHFLKQMLRVELPIPYDIGISEHLHKSDMEHFVWQQLDRVAVACGSYKVKDPWAESIGFYTGGYGVPAVVLFPQERRIIPFLHLRNAVALLDGV